MTTRPPTSNVRRVLVLLLVCGLVGLAYSYRDAFQLSELAKHESAVRAYEQAHPGLLLLGAFLVYVAVSGMSIPGGAVALSLAYGWYFGWLKGLVLVSFASTAGATVAFLTSRYLFRDYFMDKFGDRLATMNRKLEAEGAFYLFSMRLIPLVPFFLLNLVMGLTPMKTWTFWWISQIGMLPGTMVYLFAGSRVPSLQVLAEQGAAGILSWEVIGGFALLGIFPLIVKKLSGCFRSFRTPDTAAT